MGKKEKQKKRERVGGREIEKRDEKGEKEERRRERGLGIEREK